MEEIDPLSPITPGDAIVSPDPVGQVPADELKAFTKSLQGRPLQERRMNTFQFEAFSLPPSRVRKLVSTTTWIMTSLAPILRIVPKQ